MGISDTTHHLCGNCVGSEDGRIAWAARKGDGTRGILSRTEAGDAKLFGRNGTLFPQICPPDRFRTGPCGRDPGTDAVHI